MFWPYYYPAEFMMPQMMPVEPYYPTFMVPEQPVWSPVKQEESDQTLKPESAETGPEHSMIDLTVEELMEAGYEIKKKIWSEEEDHLLRALAKKFKMDWDIVEKHMEGRNAKMCYSRYKRLKNSTKRVWKNSDNRRLQSLVERFG